jgi:hypothetical protein
MHVATIKIVSSHYPITITCYPITSRNNEWFLGMMEEDHTQVATEISVHNSSPYTDMVI